MNIRFNIHKIVFGLSILAIIARVPNIYQIFTRQPTIDVPIVTTVIILILGIHSIVDFIVNKKNPMMKLDKLKEKGWEQFDLESTRFVKEVFGTNQSDISLNVLKLQPFIFNTGVDDMEKIFGMYFDQIYGVNSYPPKIKRLKIKKHQGSCGLAFQNGEPQFFDIIDMKNKKVDTKTTFKFNDNQEDQTKQLKAIISIPIITAVQNKFSE
jgi:hypothetical protein